MASEAETLVVSSLRWRSPEKPPVRFEINDRVVIARIGDGMTTRAIIGHVGILTEFIDDDLPGGEFAWSQLAVEVSCRTCGGVHTMSQHELDLLGNDDSLLVQEKADLVRPNAEAVDLDIGIVKAMHVAGFVRLALDDKPLPSSDPDLKRPAWSKFVYGTSPRMMDLRVYQDILIVVARACGGTLVEWHCNKRGVYSELVTPEKLDACMVDVPFRALFQAQSVL